jgi:hypothetical protein
MFHETYPEMRFVGKPRRCKLSGLKSTKVPSPPPREKSSLARPHTQESVCKRSPPAPQWQISETVACGPLIAVLSRLLCPVCPYPLSLSWLYWAVLLGWLGFLVMTFWVFLPSSVTTIETVGTVLTADRWQLSCDSNPVQAVWISLIL